MKVVLGTLRGVGTETRERSFTVPDPGAPVLFKMRYSGTDEFKLSVVDSDHGARYERLLTQERLSGPYEGVRALAFRNGMFEGQHGAVDAFRIHVEGTGAWEVTVGLPDLEAPPVTVAEGMGDSVVGPFVLRSPDPFVADFRFAVTHQGRDFDARLIASDGRVRTLVPHQNVSFENRKATVNVFAPWNPDKGADDLSYDDYVLDIHADGEWAVQLLNPAPEATPPEEGIPLKRVLGTYRGFGSEELLHSIAYADVPSSPMLFDIEFRGGSEFEVVLENMFADFRRRLTPHATIGPYHGVRALPYRDGEIDGQAIPWFKILVEGLGAWEVKIGLPDFDSPAVTSANGRGDSVIGPFVLRSQNPFAADFLFDVAHVGARFEARLIASDGAAAYLVPPQHIPFANRRTPLTLQNPGALGRDPDDLSYDKYVLAIQADGEWVVRLIKAGGL